MTPCPPFNACLVIAAGTRSPGPRSRAGEGGRHNRRDRPRRAPGTYTLTWPCRRPQPRLSASNRRALSIQACIARNCYPSPLNYYNFPKSCCTSVNEVICHGIPDRRPLEEGDILNGGLPAPHGPLYTLSLQSHPQWRTRLWKVELRLDEGNVLVKIKILLLRHD